MTKKPEINLDTFAARLRHAREEQGLSRPDLSKLTNRALTARVIDHLESGHTEATLSRAELLAEALEVEKLWLLYGEEAGTAPGSEETDPDDEPGTPPWDTQETGNTGQTGPEKPVQTGPDRSGAVGSSADRSDRSPDSGKERHNRLEDVSRQFVDKMFDLLETVDMFRESGFLKHQRKMPHILEQLETTAKYLEHEELKEIAFDREVDIDSQADGNFEELTARVIDTAVLGADLYDVDFDVLKAFARRNDIERPLLSSWKGHGHLVPLVRPAYREKALSEALTKSTALALAS
jgi:transcriptional regulator with XRE-family HTH domain